MPACRRFKSQHDPEASQSILACSVWRNASDRSAYRVSENHWLLFRQLSAVRYGRSSFEYVNLHAYAYADHHRLLDWRCAAVVAAATT